MSIQTSYEIHYPENQNETKIEGNFDTVLSQIARTTLELYQTFENTFSNAIGFRLLVKPLEFAHQDLKNSKTYTSIQIIVRGMKSRARVRVVLVDLQSREHNFNDFRHMYFLV